MKIRQAIITFIIGVISTLLIGLTLFSFDELVLITKIKYDRLSELEERYEKVEDIKEDIMDKFYLGVDEETLETGMIRGMFDATGDKYTTYMTEDEFDAYNDSTNGNYVGIGILSDVSEDQIHITRVFPKSPAEGAGILAGDYVVEVDGEHIDDVGYERLIDIMLGEEDTAIEVIIIRNDEDMVFNLKRGKVDIPFVSSTVIDNIGYLHIYQFGTDVSKEFKKHIKSLEAQDVEGIIIDVRDNPGGLVTESTKIADELMGKGLIIYTLDNKGKRREYTSDRGKLDTPIVFLANEHSASASEILLGAIKDTDTAEIIGVQTFGKGIVQGVSSLRDGSGYKITFSQYFTPSGEVIHEKGVEPDYIIEYEGIIDGEEPDTDEDLQLIKAIEVLNELILSN